MADSSLKDPVVIQATRLDSSILPRNIFSQSYLLYVISQGSDLGLVASKANEAGNGAYDAQVTNDLQDIKITANTNAIALIDVRLTTAEGKIITLRSDVDFLLDEVVDIEAQVSAIAADYVSKTTASPQSLASTLGIATQLSVNGTKVVGTRVTGWTATTGTALFGAFNANQAYTVSATYTQAEVQAIATGLDQARKRIKALEDSMRGHGLIN
jgi:hypothetical protein